MAFLRFEDLRVFQLAENYVTRFGLWQYLGGILKKTQSACN